MYREEVIALMTNAINDMNRQVAMQQQMPSEQIDQMIVAMQPQLINVNGMLYDLLKSNGIINN